MKDATADGEIEKPVTSLGREVIGNNRARSFGRPSLSDGAAELVASKMIARHGASAAREATTKLNRMIDRGDMPGRDLWARVVHIIHQRRAC